jgi:hypothetical protein
MKANFIAIGSKARAGKGTLSNLLKDQLVRRGYDVSQTSLASPLKEDCYDFLKQHFGINVFTQNTEEKAFIRNFLVAVGGMKRKKSKGTYYTQNLLKRVKVLSSDFVIVDDLRYADLANYPDDELAFFKKQNAYIIHVDRIDGNGCPIPYVNQDEAENDPKIKEWAHSQLVWKTTGGVITQEMLDYANRLSNDILNHYGLQ